jgi:hypothetical protein
MANRIKPILKKVNQKNSPEFNLALLFNVIDTTTIVPKKDNFYVFVYQAKTPNITYDQHPFIVCSSILPWGFIGYNFHWEEYRRYSWAEVITNLYEINNEEITTMQNFPIARFKRT